MHSVRSGRKAKQHLTVPLILAWADRYRRQHGRWPGVESVRVEGMGSETWSRIDAALVKGHRGLPSGSSLAVELQRSRHVYRGKDRVTEDQIFRWAKSCFRRTGNWPQAADGPVPEAERTTWDSLNKALIRGARGLPGGSCLKKLLVARRAIRRGRRCWCSEFTLAQIWKWARAFHKRHGEWPRTASGPIPESNGDTWRKVNSALTVGIRGLGGGSSLRKFLVSKGAGVRFEHSASLTPRQILAWADAHFEESSNWPYVDSGRIAGTTDETWGMIDAALRYGRRGLPGGSSLSAFLIEHRPVDTVGSRRRYRTSKAKLALDEIRTWAKNHRKRTGEWPHSDSGLVHFQARLTWRIVDIALRRGCRGLPGGSSLCRLFGRKNHRR